MTANKNIPITNGERRRKRSRLLRQRVREWRTQIQELLAAAYEQMISQKVNPTAERLLLQVYPQAKAILPRIVNYDMIKMKQNNVQSDTENVKNIGIFNITFEGEVKDDDGADNVGHQ